jgi:plastocyanin
MRTIASIAVLLAGLTPPGASTNGVRGTVHAGNRPQADAVVWLDVRDAAPARSAHAVLDQRNLTFEPHVLAIQVGTTVELPNHDRVFHNVFSFHDGKRFDLGLYPVGSSRRLMFDRPGLSRVFCNIHPGMAAYVLAVETPYFAVSDAQGRFSIPSIPIGTYTYHAWRAGVETISGSVTVDPETPLDLRWP